jgi:DNA-binding protein HU-beta
MVFSENRLRFSGPCVGFRQGCSAQTESRAQRPAFSCEKPSISGLFPPFFCLFDLVAGTLLSKVPFLPDESIVPVFSWKGIFMNKNELVSAVADAASISKGDAQSAVDAVFSVITGELKKGGDVRLVGFGNFTVSKRAASTGRNPQTGAEVKIPARTEPKFSAGKGLKDAVN